MARVVVALVVLAAAAPAALGAGPFGGPDAPPVPALPGGQADPVPSPAPAPPVAPAPRSPSPPAAVPVAPSGPSAAELAAARARRVQAQRARERARRAEALRRRVEGRRIAAVAASVGRRIDDAQDRVDTATRVAAAEAPDEAPPVARSTLETIALAAGASALLLAALGGLVMRRQRRADGRASLRAQFAPYARGVVLWTVVASLVGITAAVLVLSGSGAPI